MKSLYKDYNLTLGGGGSRGLAHIGVLRQLKNIKEPCKITGCSMGAIVGALYAIYSDADIAFQKIQQIIESDTFKQFKLEKAVNIFSSYLMVTALYTRKYLLSYRKIHDLLSEIIDPDLDFKDLKIKLELIAFDILSGKTIVLNKGNVLKAVISSAAIPGIVEAVSMDDYLLVDGGVSGSTPFSLLEKDKINIISDVVYIPSGDFELKNGLQFFYRSLEWQLFYYEQLNNKFFSINNKKNLIITPDVNKYQLKDFNKYDEIVLKGELECIHKKKEIQNMLKKSFLEKILNYKSSRNR